MPRKKAPPVTPTMPPATAEEVAQQQQLLADMHRITARLQQRNLDNAVLLAQQAARNRGPLVEHFAELGRRFGDTLDAPEKPKLRVIVGKSA